MAVGLMMAALLLAGPASADDYVGTPPPNAGNIDIGGSGGGAVAASSGNVAQVAHDSNHRSSELAYTGWAALLLMVALLLVGTGYLLKGKADRPVT